MSGPTNMIISDGIPFYNVLQSSEVVSLYRTRKILLVTVSFSPKLPNYWITRTVPTKASWKEWGLPITVRETKIGEIQTSS